MDWQHWQRHQNVSGLRTRPPHFRSWKAHNPGLIGCGILGDIHRWNPEELLVASLSACHKLWFLALCSQAGVVVTAYEDMAEGSMVEELNGAGQFTAVTLHPRVTISAGSDEAKAKELHHPAHEMCFIARSVNFPVNNEPTIVRESGVAI